MQVIMMFAQPFWPAGFFDVVCTDSFIPEFWVTAPPSHQQQQPSTQDATHHAAMPKHALPHAQAAAATPHTADQEETVQLPPDSQVQNVVLNHQSGAQHAHHGSRPQNCRAPAEHQPGTDKDDSALHTAGGQGAPSRDAPPEEMYCRVGFVAGSRAEEISKLRQNTVVIRTLSQLDQMFGESVTCTSKLNVPLCKGG